MNIEKYSSSELLIKKIIVTEIIITTLITVSAYFCFRNWYLDKQILSLVKS